MVFAFDLKLNSLRGEAKPPKPHPLRVCVFLFTVSKGSGITFGDP
jgi:hypothetical protein